MTGGALPVRGGIVLSTERMRRIIEIDVHDRVAVVEPGVINGDLQAAVEAEGLFYPPDPGQPGVLLDRRQRRRERGRAARLQVRRHARLRSA